MARTVAVNILVAGQLVCHVNVRDFTARSFARDALHGNRVVLRASLILIGLQLAFTCAPPKQRLFKTGAVDAVSWPLILLPGAALFAAVEADKWLQRRRGVHHM